MLGPGATKQKMEQPGTVKEEVDIDKESSELATYSDGSLERVDRLNRIKVHWFKERTIVWVSALVILTVLAASVLILGFSADESSRDWARQMLAALMGFAAGAIWQTHKKGD